MTSYAADYTNKFIYVVTAYVIRFLLSKGGGLRRSFSALGPHNFTLYTSPRINNKIRTQRRVKIMSDYNNIIVIIYVHRCKRRWWRRLSCVCNVHRVKMIMYSIRRHMKQSLIIRTLNFPSNAFPLGSSCSTIFFHCTRRHARIAKETRNAETHALYIGQLLCKFLGLYIPYINNMSVNFFVGLVLILLTTGFRNR